MKDSRPKTQGPPTLLLVAATALVVFACGDGAPAGGNQTRSRFVPVESAGELDFSSAASLPFLLSGWGEPELGNGDRSFVPGLGGGSTLLLPSLGSAATVLTLEGRPFPGIGELTVGASIRGNPIGSASLAAQGGVIQFDIPPALTTQGSVQVDLSYAGSKSQDVSTAEKVVIWRKARYESVDAPPKPLRVGLWPASLPGDENVVFDQGQFAGPALIGGSDPIQPRPVDDEPCSRPVSPRLPNIVLYLIDTLRVDRVGAYGDDRGLTPNIDALAKKAIVLEQAVAQSPWTRPSVVSLMTGLAPPSHGVITKRHALAPEYLTLAEVLSAQGYATVGLITNPNISGKFGLRQGFDVYSSVRSGATARAVNTAANDWLRHERPSNQPFFMYLHTVEPHAPYQPSEEFARRFAATVKNPNRYTRKFMREELVSKQGEELSTIRREMELLYDAEVAENDAAFGDLLDLLGDPGLENTVVIVVSDHGEEFFEHGRWEHGKSLHTEVLDVPFVIYLPGCAPRRVKRTTQHADLLPTLLDYLEFEDLPGLVGESVLCSDCGPRAVLSHVGMDSHHGTALTTTGSRFIDPVGPSMGGSTLLYDRSKDPLETRSVLSERPIGALYFAAQLAQLSSTSVSAPEIDESALDPEMVKRLRSLGYIE